MATVNLSVRTKELCILHVFYFIHRIIILKKYVEIITAVKKYIFQLLQFRQSINYWGGYRTTGN